MKTDFIDVTTKVGSQILTSPILLASGTAGYSDELADFGDLALLGAIVVKSLTWYPYPGNPAPRLMGVEAGMVNSVGLQGEGLEHFLSEELQNLVEKNASVVISVWGQSVKDFQKCAELLSDLPTNVIAVEVNLSCPNLADKIIFAHDPVLTKEIISSFKDLRKPIWAKLSPNTDRIIEIAAVALENGAEALSVFNTLSAMAVELSKEKGRIRFVLGGLSGKALKPVSLRGVYLLRKNFPDAGIVALGGVTSAMDVAHYLAVGADATAIGTANFIDPSISFKILKSFKTYLVKQGFDSVESFKNCYRKNL